MNTSRNFKATLIVVALLSFSVAQAATLTLADYQAAKNRISAEYKLDKKACDGLDDMDNAEDICEEEARARKNIALAEQKFSYTGKASDRARLRQTKAASAYAVAKEKCDDLPDAAEDVCEAAARAQFGQK